MTEKAKKSHDRYEAAVAGLTQGVSILVQEQPSQRVTGECSPKELRTAVLVANIRLDAIQNLILRAGCSEEDLFEAFAATAEDYVKRFEERLTKMMGGRKVKLS